MALFSKPACLFRSALLLGTSEYLCPVGCLSLAFLNWNSQQGRTQQTKISVQPIMRKVWCHQSNLGFMVLILLFLVLKHSIAFSSGPFCKQISNLWMTLISAYVVERSRSRWAWKYLFSLCLAQSPKSHFLFVNLSTGWIGK